jgi:hypothetical protein
MYLWLHSSCKVAAIDHVQTLVAGVQHRAHRVLTYTSAQNSDVACSIFHQQWSSSWLTRRTMPIHLLRYVNRVRCIARRLGRYSAFQPPSRRASIHEAYKVSCCELRIVSVQRWPQYGNYRHRCKKPCGSQMTDTAIHNNRMGTCLTPDRSSHVHLSSCHSLRTLASGVVIRSCFCSPTARADALCQLRLGGQRVLCCCCCCSCCCCCDWNVC